jgi:hypothetical protein
MRKGGRNMAAEKSPRAMPYARDEKGADLAGVPVGDQTASNPDAAHTEQVVQETGEGVGLAVPGDPGRTAGEPAGDTASEP